MSKLWIVIFIVLSCGPEEVLIPDRFKSKPVIPEKYKNEDEIILNKTVTYRVQRNDQDQIVVTKRFEIDGYINNPENVRAVYRVSYQDGFESVKMGEVYYINNAGKRIDIKNIQDVKLNSDSFYDSSRAKIFGFRNFTKGSMYHYAYEITYNNINITDIVSFFGQKPILKKTVNVQNLIKEAVYFESTGDFTHINGDKLNSVPGNSSFSYHFKNIDSYKIYENYSMVRQLLPYYHFYIQSDEFITDWTSMGSYFHELNKDNFQVSDQNYNQIVSNISYSNDDEFIQNLFYYIQDNIRYVALIDGIKAYKADSPETVLRNKYGECKGMSFLLVSLLRKKGITSAPAIVNLGADNFNLSNPKLYMANHCIAYAETENGRYWLDATGYYLKANSITPSLSEKRALVVFDKDKSELKTTPAVDYEGNRIRYALELEVDGTDLTGNVEISMGSYSAFQFRNVLQISHQLDVKEKMKTILSAQFEKSKITDLTLENIEDPTQDLILKFKLRYLNAVNKFGNRQIINLNPITYLKSTKFSGSKHEGMFFYDDASLVELVVNLKKAKGDKVKSKSDEISFNQDFISYDRRYTEHDEKISFSSRSQIRKTYLTEKDYQYYSENYLSMKDIFNINVQLITGD